MTIIDHVIDSNRNYEAVSLVFVAQVSKELNALVKKRKEEKGIKDNKPKPSTFHGYFASQGFLSLMKYAHEHGCEWGDEAACNEAAANGHLACLKYAHENGCDWYVCARLLTNRHSPLLLQE